MNFIKMQLSSSVLRINSDIKIIYIIELGED